MFKFKLTVIVSLVLILIAGCFYATSLAVEPIKIGLVSPKSGNYADHGGMERVGMYLAVEDFGGEVLGRPIELIEADSETNPDIASRRAKALIETENVMFLMGGVSSSVGIAVGAVCEAAGALFIASNENSDTITGSDAMKHMFRVPPNMAILVRGAAQYVADNLGKKWYFITHDYSWGQSGTRWARNMLDVVGAKEIGEVLIPMNTRDFSSYLLQVANSGAEVACVTVGGFDGIALYKQMSEFGIFDKMKVWWTLADYPDSYALQPEQRGRYGMMEIYWTATPELIEFSKRINEKNPNAPVHVTETNSYSGWLGMTALLKGIEAAGTTDVDAVIKAMEGMIICDNMQPNPTYIRPWDHQFIDSMFFGVDNQESGDDITEVLFSMPCKDFARTFSENPVDLTK